MHGVSPNLSEEASGEVSDKDPPSAPPTPSSQAERLEAYLAFHQASASDTETLTEGTLPSVPANPVHVEPVPPPVKPVPPPEVPANPVHVAHVSPPRVPPPPMPANPVSSHLNNLGIAMAQEEPNVVIVNKSHEEGQPQTDARDTFGLSPDEASIFSDTYHVSENMYEQLAPKGADEVRPDGSGLHQATSEGDPDLKKWEDLRTRQEELARLLQNSIATQTGGPTQQYVENNSTLILELTAVNEEMQRIAGKQVLHEQTRLQDLEDEDATPQRKKGAGEQGACQCCGMKGRRLKTCGRQHVCLETLAGRSCKRKTRYYQCFPCAKKQRYVVVEGITLKDTDRFLKACAKCNSKHFDWLEVCVQCKNCEEVPVQQNLLPAQCKIRCDTCDREHSKWAVFAANPQTS